MSIQLNKIEGIIDAEITLPASKSINNRVLIIDALTGFQCKIENQSTAQDTQTLIQILSSFNKGESHVNVGHAGTTMRFLTAFFTLQKGTQVLTGSERMKERPIHILVDALNNIGANIEYLEKVGYPPIKINDCTPSKNSIEIDGGVSSQYITSLMLVAPYLRNGLSIKLINNLVSKPYIKMTQNIMSYFGANVNFKESEINIQAGKYIPQKFYVEGDWSGASYWYSVIALSENGTLKINNLQKNSLQGDAIVAEIYSKFGVDTTYFENHIQIKKVRKIIDIDCFEYDFTNCPDLAQTVVVTCLGLNIKAKFKGLSTLLIKETNRLKALKNECEKLGATVIIDDNTLELYPKVLISSSIKTYDDHRMAMAFAPLAMKIDGLIIENEDVVKKSYPSFWTDFNKL